MCHLIVPAILPSDEIRYIQDWLTMPPADLRPDSTDEEVRALSWRIIDEAIDQHLPLEGRSPLEILMWMRAALSGHIWEHIFECHACGLHDTCRVSCIAPTPDRWYTMGDPECPWRRTDPYGEDIAVWEYRGVRQVPFAGGDAE